jgi:putative heme-binding domain-containing protein
LRHRLEAFHGQQDPQAVAEAWPYLTNPDRFLRWAARTSIEHQPPATWADRALQEPNSSAKLEALLALARTTQIDPQHRQPTDAANDKVLQSIILASLARFDWNALGEEDRLKLVRCYEILFVRGGPPDAALAKSIIAQLEPQFPSPSFPLNWLLCETLAYLQSPGLAAKGVALLENSPSQEEQIEYARSLRMLKAGWTLPLRTTYFNWFFKAANYRGGASFDKFVEFIRNDALVTLDDSEKASLADLLAKVPARKSPLEGMAELFKGRTPRNWTLDELAAAAAEGMKHRNFEQGRKMFGAALCYTCHRFVNEGGMTGPDLTSAGARYSTRDLLDQIINPSKVINEQFVPTVIVTEDDEVITGVIVNLNGDAIMVNTDPVDPWKQTTVDRKKVVSMEPSKASPMPTSLLAMLTQDEILDLLAYIIAGANPQADVYRK